jgi:ABC-type transport system involved in multi-copper enzyme maturation permease subunit
MILLIFLVLISSILFFNGGIMLYLLKGKKKLYSLIPFGFLVLFMLIIGFILLALTYFGEGPRDYGQIMKIEQKKQL